MFYSILFKNDFIGHQGFVLKNYRLLLDYRALLSGMNVRLICIVIV